MTTTDYKEWMQRAFLKVEAALSEELITPASLCMTEDHIRSALVRGLAAAMPTHAHRIDTEKTVSWTNNPCWLGTNRVPEQGRPIQHDVFIAPHDGDNGLACEVKWLKNEKAGEVLKDIWKLVLSRGIASEGSAMRIYFLLGGEGEHFRATINALYHHTPRMADLSWQRTDQALPNPKRLTMANLLGTAKGKNAVRDLLKWGSPPTYRTPPSCRNEFYTDTRATWRRPLDGQIKKKDGGVLVWNAALWEITAWGLSTRPALNWTAKRDAMLAPSPDSKSTVRR
ncbi:MAG: hypothetical protein IPJ76_00025 [Flavobacteriales bacterium]|nr:MAG: hypothetical protein IPJ76_18905 [Flavobacteriales bacterium]QQR86646.1 MAG: hypothetical protein IPJ76_00025 [Flavobacteriales bacterium]